MKGILKKLAASLLVLIAGTGLLPVLCRADELHVSAKHVCIVYDDSGSMYEKGGSPVMDWARANYMVQAFCALLNAEDTLHIIYMSDIEGSIERGDYMSSGRAQSIQEIRSWRGDAQTPFAAVEAGYQILHSLQEQSGDEYWLVVMTDGQFQGIKSDLTETFKAYIHEMALVDKTLRVVFFAIGDGAETPQADEENGLTVYKTDEHGIITTMLALSDNISARQAIPYTDMRADGNSITFSSRIAPASLIIINQDSRNPVDSIQNDDGELKATEHYLIAAPESFSRNNLDQAITDDSLSGIITHYIPHSGHLAPGRYTITFKNQVDIQKLRILYQPAATLQFRFLEGGKIVESPKDGDIVDIEVLLVNSATGRPFDASVLSGELEYHLTLLSRGEVILTESSPVIRDVVLSDGDTAISAEAVMPGYFTLRSKLNFTEQTQAPADRPDYGESDGPWPPEITLQAQAGQFSRVKLKNLENAVFKLIPYYNGSKVAAEDLQKGHLEITCPRNVNFTYAVAPDGSFDIRPKYGRDMLSTSTGAVSVTFVYTSAYESKASATMTFYIEDMGWVQRNIQALWLPFVLGFIAVLICGVLFFHKKLPKSGGIEYSHFTKDRRGQWQQGSQASVAGFKNLKGSWVYIPFSRERITVSGITFYPAKNNQSLLVSLKGVGGTISTEPRDALVKKGAGFSLLKSGTRLIIEQENYKIVLRYIAPKHSLIQK